LQAALETKVQEAKAYDGQIDTLKKQLADLNKPKLTAEQFDELTGFIEDGINSFDFDDADNYSFDFHIDYDNRIAIESLTFDNAHELSRVICDEVYNMFGEAKEDDNQENQD
jgi:hypothetical protein